ncbi:type II toxin-antitoxin system PemK/MazF family toxin [Verminephrobacter aporrectodeae]|uniref:type II toxin-antitoxin system PemK/MazF family toxin n=1 Tax=Verminephrobacter aporrectodeae TaxID=1110389 RepID=UPI002238EE99|nr:type II toxin-antitoxin system PemK/MazF family toxin [Verminephrobacter aporrectodeae]
MMRGDIVTVAMPGDLGQPRPALVIQADLFGEHPTVTVLPVTSTLVDAPLLRITVAPGAGSGLRQPAQIMVDKMLPVKRDGVGPAIGRIDAHTMVAVERSLAIFLGIAK